MSIPEGLPARDETLDALFAEGSPAENTNAARVEKPKTLTKRELRQLFRGKPTQGGRPMTSQKQKFFGNLRREGVRYREKKTKRPRHET